MGDDRDQIAMNERFPTGEMDVSNIIAGQDIEGELGLLQSHGVLLFLWQPIDREIAKAATGVAYAGDREMAGAWTTINDRLDRSPP